MKQTCTLAEVVELSSPRAFFEGTVTGVDAVLYAAEAGSAWTLLSPGFAVVVPQPGLVSIPLAYAVPRDEARTAACSRRERLDDCLN